MTYLMVCNYLLFLIRENSILLLIACDNDLNALLKVCLCDNGSVVPDCSERGFIYDCLLYTSDAADE